MDTAGDDSHSPPMTVLPSSTNLFYFYGQILEQCAKLSSGQPLFDLSNLFKRWLRIYAGEFGINNACILNSSMHIEEVLATNVKR